MTTGLPADSTTHGEVQQLKETVKSISEAQQRAEERAEKWKLEMQKNVEQIMLALQLRQQAEVAPASQSQAMPSPVLTPAPPPALEPTREQAVQPAPPELPACPSQPVAKDSKDESPTPQASLPAEAPSDVQESRQADTVPTKERVSLPRAAREDAKQQVKFPSRVSAAGSQVMTEPFLAPEVRGLEPPTPASKAMKPQRGGYRLRVLLTWLFCALVLACLGITFVAYPLDTFAYVAFIFVCTIYLFAEEPCIKMIEAAAGGKAQVVVVGALRTVQAWRSIYENEHMLQVLFGTIALMLLSRTFGVLQLFNFLGLPVETVALPCLLTCVTLLSHRLARWMHNRHLRNIRRSDELVGTAEVQAAMQRLVGILTERRWGAERLLRADRSRRIYEFFEKSEAVLLNGLLDCMSQSQEYSIGRVLRDAGDNHARTKLIELLGVHRCQDLGLRARRSLIHALMVMKMVDGCQAVVANLILSLRGNELSTIKSHMDSSGDIHGLQKLIYQDITDLGLREEILKHFLRQSTTQIACRTLLANQHFKSLWKRALERDCVPDQLQFITEEEDEEEVDDGCLDPVEDLSPEDSESQAPPSTGRWLKVLTDMDDTMTSSGGVWPAGIDRAYPRKVLYPGVTAFYRELTKGGGGDGQLVALSARPHITGDLMESHIYSKFAEMMTNSGLHSMPALLPGALDAGAKFMLTSDFLVLGNKKIDSFQEYINLYPEFRIIFIGDNGQADYHVGRRMCEMFPAHIEQVWIHEVQEREKTFGYSPAHEQSSRPLNFFEDYVSAAITAATRQNPLVTPQGLQRITAAALEDFRSIKSNAWVTDVQREEAAHSLNQSVVRAAQVLKETFGIEADFELLEEKKAAAVAVPPNTGSETEESEASVNSEQVLSVETFRKVIAKAKRKGPASPQPATVVEAEGSTAASENPQPVEGEESLEDDLTAELQQGADPGGDLLLPTATRQAATNGAADDGQAVSSSGVEKLRRGWAKAGHGVAGFWPMTSLTRSERKGSDEEESPTPTKTNKAGGPSQSSKPQEVAPAAVENGRGQHSSTDTPENTSRPPSPPMQPSTEPGTPAPAATPREDVRSTVQSIRMGLAKAVGMRTSTPEVVPPTPVDHPASRPSTPRGQPVVEPGAPEMLPPAAVVSEEAS